MLGQMDLKGMTRDEVLGQNRIIKQMTGGILQRALDAEMDGHLGYAGL
jgi:hypothetical protein